MTDSIARYRPRMRSRLGRYLAEEEYKIPLIVVETKRNHNGIE